jgi:hypothetical protein
MLSVAHLHIKKSAPETYLHGQAAGVPVIVNGLLMPS